MIRFVLYLFVFLCACHSDLPIESECLGVKSPLMTDQKAYVDINSNKIRLDYVAPRTGSYNYEWSYAGGNKESKELQPILDYLDLGLLNGRVMQISLFYNDMIGENEEKIFNIKELLGWLIYRIDNNGEVIGVVLNPGGELIKEFRPKKTSVYRTAYILYETVKAPLNSATFIDFYNSDIKEARINNSIQVNYAKEYCEMERLLIRKLKKFKLRNAQTRAPDCPEPCLLGPLDDCAPNNPYPQYECDYIFDDDGPCEEEYMYLSLSNDPLYYDLADSLQNIMPIHYTFRDSFLGSAIEGLDLIALYYSLSSKMEDLRTTSQFSVPISLKVSTAQYLIGNSNKLEILNNHSSFPDEILLSPEEVEDLLVIISEYETLSEDQDYRALIATLKEELLSISGMSVSEIVNSYN